MFSPVLSCVVVLSNATCKTFPVFNNDNGAYIQSKFSLIYIHIFLFGCVAVGVSFWPGHSNLISTFCSIFHHRCYHSIQSLETTNNANDHISELYFQKKKKCFEWKLQKRHDVIIRMSVDFRLFFFRCGLWIKWKKKNSFRW